MEKIHLREFSTLEDTYVSSMDNHTYLINNTITFYFRLFSVVIWSFRKVKQKMYDGKNWIIASLKIKSCIERAGIKLTVEGMKNISGVDGPVIFVSNHMSSAETMVLPAIIYPHKPVCFIMKEELLKVPLFGAVSGATHPILVGRTNPRNDLMKVIEEGGKTIKDGRSIIVFPQKTRSQMLNKKSFNSIGAKLAKNNNVPIIPIALVTDAWGTGKIIKDFGPINSNKEMKISFGTPLLISEYGNNINDKAIEFIENKFIEWGRAEFIKD